MSALDIRKSVHNLMRRILLSPLAPRVWVHRPPCVGKALGVTGTRRILIIKLDALGDAILLFPFIRRIQFGLPNVPIDIVCTPVTRALWESSPWVDRTYVVPQPGFGLVDHYRKAYRTRALGRRLAKNGYDIAFVPRWDVDNGYGPQLAYEAQATRRVGFSATVTPEKAFWNRDYDKFLTHPIYAAGPEPEVKMNDRLLDALELPLSPADMRPWPAPDNPKPLSVDHSGPVCAIAPFAADTNRVWPLTRYLDVVCAIHAETGACFVAVGGPEVRACLVKWCESVPDDIRITVIPEANSVLDTINILRQADLFVGADSAPAHMAAAAQIPCVVVSAHARSCSPVSTHAPERFAPFGISAIVCRPDAPVPPCQTECDRTGPHCINAVDTGQVIRAALQSLNQTTPNVP